MKGIKGDTLRLPITSFQDDFTIVARRENIKKSAKLIKDEEVFQIVAVSDDGNTFSIKELSKGEVSRVDLWSLSREYKPLEERSPQSQVLQPRVGKMVTKQGKMFLIKAVTQGEGKTKSTPKSTSLLLNLSKKNFVPDTLATSCFSDVH